MDQDLKNYLSRIQFPAEQKDILETAKRNNIPEDVLKVISLFPNRRYQSLDDLLRAFGTDASESSTVEYGVNDTSRVGENAYMQRGAEESFQPESRTGGL
ncbi:MAG TPA: DUF2795 domain-containing protein [Oligoflexus sp.]|uniref:DUF2795 domain-containing protein n=1 Tax=Oligoflexus sp. TaxID=1971216 RepID=UPI002D705DB2|nr:DUF2795 domain-containing protein [Oligoflexus sp.]HYX39335.1 DUF2795 domain-containing protein [Oligoflexus sp.]